jgi:hypothetical protein
VSCRVVCRVPCVRAVAFHLSFAGPPSCQLPVLGPGSLILVLVVCAGVCGCVPLWLTSLSTNGTVTTATTTKTTTTTETTTTTTMTMTTRDDSDDQPGKGPPALRPLRCFDATEKYNSPPSSLTTQLNFNSIL